MSVLGAIATAGKAIGGWLANNPQVVTSALTLAGKGMSNLLGQTSDSQSIGSNHGILRQVLWLARRTECFPEKNKPTKYANTDGLQHAWSNPARNL